MSPSVMRSDMYEVIIERPRFAHRARYPRAWMAHRTGARDLDADPPTRERMGGIYADKHLNENLAPIVRYLRTNTGRPWSKVRSEIAARLSVGSAVQKHVMDHVKEYVTERVHQDACGGWIGADRFGRPSRPWFYAHPRTGLLCELAREPRKQHSRARIRRPDVRVLSDTRELRRIRGIWYDVEIAPIPGAGTPLAQVGVRDAVAKIDLGKRHGCAPGIADAMRDTWRAQRYARSIRQLSKREIRTLLGG